jgi:hypothetical protein
MPNKSGNKLVYTPSKKNELSDGELESGDFEEKTQSKPNKIPNSKRPMGHNGSEIFDMEQQRPHN